jgi:hypothetical protein
MPARPHRTVDRVRPDPRHRLTEPARRDPRRAGSRPRRAKSSVQELTNGLLARGYLIEEQHRFHLGPGPFILAGRANKTAALSLDHHFVTELADTLGLHRPRSASASATPSSSSTTSAKNHPA